MANTITYVMQPQLEQVQMSNGLTQLFIAALTLSASALAQNDAQKTLAVWIASHDQGMFGSGIVGFDVCEMPWDSSAIDRDKAFWFSVIEGARAKFGWELWKYTPQEDWLLLRLEQFSALIEAFQPRDICDDQKRVWVFTPLPKTFNLCEQHRLYLHEYGCLLCNDEAEQA